MLKFRKSKKSLTNQLCQSPTETRRLNQDFFPSTPSPYTPSSTNDVVKGVTIGTNLKRWTRVYVDIQKIHTQNIQSCVVFNTDTPPASLNANFGSYYFIYTNATVGLRKIYRWDGSAFVTYNPTVVGECWLSRTDGGATSLSARMFVWNGTNLLRLILS